MVQAQTMFVLDLRVHTQNLGGRWLAFETQTGILVFADTEEQAIDRLQDTVSLTLDSIAEDGWQYAAGYLADRIQSLQAVPELSWKVGNIIPTEKPELANVL